MSGRTAGASWASSLAALCALLFSTGASAGSFSFSGTNVGAIPDGAGAGPRNYGATRDIRFEVTGVTGTLTGAGVQFTADHPFVGDLRVSLIAPTGVEHLVFESTGATTPTGAGSAANLVSANQQTFIENGSNWWTNAGLADANIPASTSRSVVAGPVAAPPPATTSFNTTFLNQPANGTWILRFQDGWTGDVGSVTAATLLLLANFSTRTVTKVADTNDGTCDADCSLREAIAVAAPGDLVSFASPFFDTPRAIVLGGTLLLIDKSLAIVGPGADKLTISANGQSGVFRVLGAGARVTLSGLRMIDGAAIGGIELRQAELVMARCEVSNNRGTFAGGIVVGTSNPEARLQVYDSSITNNVSSGAFPSAAGGIYAFGATQLERVTIAGNSVLSGGGAAGVLAALGTLVITDSTLTGNRATDATGGVGTESGTQLVLRNSVIAGNGSALGAADISGGGVASLGHNLIGDVGSVTGVFNQPGDQSGTTPAPLDARLGPLSHNGGTVPVHAPLQGSPLLDQGKAFGADARGVARAVDLASIAPATGGNNADIGAVEVAPQVVINTDDAGAGSLRQAIADAPVAPAVSDIWFDPALTAAPATITLTSGQLSIDRNLAIHGPGAQRLAISGNRQSRVIGVQANRRVGLSGMTFTDGNGVGLPNTGEGGAILIAPGSHLSITSAVIRGNTTTNKAGVAIRVRDAAALVLRAITVADNATTFADHIVQSGFDSLLLIESSTLSGNRTPERTVQIISGYARIDSSTIAGNSNGARGAIRIRNTILANSGIDVEGDAISYGHNLVRDIGAAAGFTQPGDQTGNAASPLDPKLSPLAIHSGQVPTQMPLAGSPALDQGLRYGRDQRGLNGIVDIGAIGAADGGNNADIGAVEAQAIFVSSVNDSGAGSLRQAILDANANGPGTDDVLFSMGLPATINLSSRLPQPTGPMNFDGPGAQLATISRAVGAPAFGLLDVFQPVQIGITRLGFLNGLDDGSNGGDSFGGGIDAFNAELHLTEVEIAGSQATSGAGLSLANGDGVISDSAITANIASTQGGGIYFQGNNHRLLLRGSTIGSNAANGSGLGGGIAHVGFGATTSNSRLEVSSSTIAGNGGGGGIRTASAAATSTTVTHLQSTLLANNVGGNLVLVTSTGPGNVDSRGYNLSNTPEPLLGHATDRTNVNPQLGLLQYNGGGTRTYALQAGSAAIDGGIRTGGFLDQRGVGFERSVDLSPANAVGGDGTDIGAFEQQTEPVVPPTVVSIVRASANPTAPGSSVDFTVTISTVVVGVDTGDFALTSTGVTGAAITGVSTLTPSTYRVSVSVGTGSGSVRLDLIDNDSIVNGGGVPLGGPGAGNGSFTTGEVYTVAAVVNLVFANGFE